MTIEHDSPKTARFFLRFIQSTFTMLFRTDSIETVSAAPRRTMTNARNLTASFLNSNHLQMSNEESSINISNASHAGSYKTSEIHMLAPPSNNQMNNCFTAKPQGPGYQTSKLLSPPRSQRSTPTPSPTSSPSPPFQDEVIRALRHRSGGLERVKRITAAGRAATGKPPVKHIQEQYLAVFSRFSDFCTSQNLPTWPIEPVRVAIWVLAMQEKAPPTPATLRQYITRLEFTCTVTAGLFEGEFGASSPLKASALLRELVNRDIPAKSNRKRGRSPSSFENHEGSQTPPTKKWQPFDNVAHEYAEQYDRYITPFSNSSGYPNNALVAHQNHHEIWPTHAHQPSDRYSAENIHQNHSIPQHYHPHNGHLIEHHHPHPNENSRSHEVVGNVVQLQSGHRGISQHARYYPSAYESIHGHSNFPAHQAMVQPTSDGRYIAETVHSPWV
ncbi:hypothetical protein BY996DRAFT_6442798 [Phakopsora pachyrhizi]|nr:hypothetical protein BY996DRAFT_6442798 [Phakopsora pachyrhizi]